MWPMSGGLALSPGSIAERQPSGRRRTKRSEKNERRGSTEREARRESAESCETRKRMGIFEHSSQRDKIARVSQVAERAENVTSFQAVKAVAEGNREVQHHAGVAIAVGNASGAAVAHRRGVCEVPDWTDALAPGIAAPHVV